MKKDYCSCVPDKLLGISLTTPCKNHDNAVGQAGTYNPITPHIAFAIDLYNTDLRKSFLGWLIIITYTIGGTFFSTLKYPYFVYRKYQYRKGL